MAKLQMLEIYYDFLDTYFSRQDFELCYKDTESFYFTMSGDPLDKIAKPEMKQVYETDKKNWFATDKFSKRTPGLFKPEFVGARGAWLTAKCYLVQNQNKIRENKYSCTGFSRKHVLHFGLYKDALDLLQKTRIDCHVLIMLWVLCYYATYAMF